MSYTQYAIALLIVTMPLHAQDTPLLCNGHAQLCDRRYNEVAYAATHNGQSHKESEVHNQDLDIVQQLTQGIRATKIHIWPGQDETGATIPFACHGIDKNLLYSMTGDKILEQIPALFRSSFKEQFKKLSPLRQVVSDALKVAYGDGQSAGVIPFKHGVFDPATRPLRLILIDIKKFLDTHPHEIFTLILEDHTHDLTLIAHDITSVGLQDYAYVQDIQRPWPTLREMITQNKRLVIFVHGQEGLPYSQYPWMHYIWDFAWDTAWDFVTVCDLKNGINDTMPKRGQKAYEQRNTAPRNKIFVVHHFVTPLMGGSKASAKKVNKSTFLRTRLAKFAQKSHHIPNIVQVDFFEQPNNDIFAVIDELNGVGAYHSTPLCVFK